MTSKNILLTGATSGIGEAAAIEFARDGHNLFLTARSKEKAAATEALVRKANPDVDIQWLYGDFARLDDVRSVAQQFIEMDKQLDILFSNAGLMSMSQKESADGYEMMFAVNHLAPFLLCHELYDKLCEGEHETRVVVTASAAHEFVRKLDLDNLETHRRFRGIREYGHSKLANVLFTQSLNTRLKSAAGEKSIFANCFHPGFVGTGLGADTVVGGLVMGMFRPFIRNGKKGAETGIFLATGAVEGSGGGYYYNCKRKKLKPFARDEEVAEALWQRSLELCGIQ